MIEMNKFRRSTLAFGLGAAVLSAGCVDLDVVSNQSDPSAEQVLSDAAELQLVVAGSWGTVWSYLENNMNVGYAMGSIGHEWSSGNATIVHYGGFEPRTQYPNDYGLNNRFVSQNPWYSIYEAIDNVTQAFKMIENDGVRIRVPDQGEELATATDKTDRVRAFGYYTQGVLYGILALTYDQASVSLHTTDRSDPNWWAYKPYNEIAQVAIAQLTKSIEIAQSAAPFTIPETWMGGHGVDNAGLARLAHTHIARIMAYLPRTPDQRRDVSNGGIVDWNKVVTHANAGIQSDVIATLSSTGLNASFIRYQGSPTIMVADPRLYGPADISGAYRDWVAKPLSERNMFRVETDDRRITGATESGEPNPTAHGTYFRYTATCCAASWPDYMRGHYIWYRNGNRWNTGTKVHLSIDELKLLKAEASYRLGDLAGAAALINPTRVNNGKLPPVTAAGVPGNLDRCVPRTLDGTACGSLLDALHHERMIELAGLNNYRSWWDRRGFGSLIEGTYTQLPVPVRELQALGVPFYTTGGTAGSSADGVFQVR